VCYSGQCNQTLHQTYAVPKRMYKKDGLVGQTEKYPGLNAKNAVVDEG